MASNDDNHILRDELLTTLIRNLLIEKENERDSERTDREQQNVRYTSPSSGSSSSAANSDATMSSLSLTQLMSSLNTNQSYCLPQHSSEHPFGECGPLIDDILRGSLLEGATALPTNATALQTTLPTLSSLASHMSPPLPPNMDSSSLLLSNYSSPLLSSSSMTTSLSSMPLILFDSTPSRNSLLTKFESHIHSIANEIQSTIQLHLNGLQMRKEQLLKQLEHIKQTYATVLAQSSPQTEDSTSLALPKISFTRPDSALYKAVTTLGFLTTPAFASNCCATGDGVEVAIEGQPTCFTITTRNCFNDELLIGGERIDIEIFASEGSSAHLPVPIPHSLLDHNNGKYTVTYTIPRGAQLKQVSVSVAINCLPLSGSPFLVSVETQRKRNAWKRIATFGSEGNQIGQFCRPWGVAIVRLPNKDPNAGKEYLIAVADRSNNRIQLLKLSLNSNCIASCGSGGSSGSPGSSDVSLSVVHVFGSGPGTRPAQFDRPAGIAINMNLGHIIVADKDNHRIQVFDISGTYQFKFGEKGSRAGQFCYPWDIDSCAQTSQILVSDTRNRRVQLFTPYGQYLWHCGQPLDSPRGVSFISSDRFVVSDFNKHRLLIIEKTSNSKDDITPKSIGFGEGSAWGEFLRPQGVVSSGATSIFCADSRNNRISVWNSVTQCFEYLTEEVISLDRPSGIAVADNLLVVVDFGNNRIQICHR